MAFKKPAPIETRLYSRIFNRRFSFFRPRIRPQNSHPVPVGPEVQDHRVDPDRHRLNRVEDVEGPDPGTPVVGPVRRHGHIQVHQAEGGRRGNLALPVAGARAPPRRIRSRQGVQRATARRTITTSREHRFIYIIPCTAIYYYFFFFSYLIIYLFIERKKKKKQ